jgi:hypothetical protein
MNEMGGTQYLSRLRFIRATYDPGMYNADWNDRSAEVNWRRTE